MDPKNPLVNHIVMADQVWHARGVEDALAGLETNAEQGLTLAEVQERQMRCGFNELQEKALPSFWELLGRQLKDFIVILLMVAALVSALLGDWIEAGIILLIVVLNAILGVVQES